MTKYRPKVGQSIALRALATMKHGREQEISTYIRRFDSVCSRYVGTMLNIHTLKHFFIQGFMKSRTISSVLEKNPRTLVDAKAAAREVDAKAAAREVDQLDKEHERLWRREDDLISQFIPIHPRTLKGTTVGQVSYVSIEVRPQPLVVRNPEP